MSIFIISYFFIKRFVQNILTSVFTFSYRREYSLHKFVVKMQTHLRFIWLSIYYLCNQKNMSNIIFEIFNKFHPHLNKEPS